MVFRDDHDQHDQGLAHRVGGPVTCIGWENVTPWSAWAQETPGRGSPSLATAAGWDVLLVGFTCITEAILMSDSFIVLVGQTNMESLRTTSRIQNGPYPYRLSTDYISMDYIYIYP